MLGSLGEDDVEGYGHHQANDAQRDGLLIPRQGLFGVVLKVVLGSHGRDETNQLAIRLGLGEQGDHDGYQDIHHEGHTGRHKGRALARQVDEVSEGRDVPESDGGSGTGYESGPTGVRGHALPEHAQNEGGK